MAAFGIVDYLNMFSIMTQQNKTTDFCKRIQGIHCSKYGTEKVQYINNKTKVILTCPEHGDFLIRPDAALAGQGCPDCANKVRSQALFKTNETFKKEAYAKWGNYYDLSLVSYQGWNAPITIKCSKHGEFQKSPYKFLQGQGCPKCAYENRGKEKALTTMDFIQKSKQIFGQDTYNYDKVEYINSKTKICLICPKHGPFWQTPDCHLHGCGCPICGHTLSKPEQEIYNYICSLMGEENVTSRDRTVLNGLEMDIYIPLMKLGIEFNGLHWHSEEYCKDKNYHIAKTIKAQEQGIHLIQIFEDEWIEHKDLILEKICHFLHKDSGKIKIGARKCTVKLIQTKIAQDFLNQYHIQGFAASTLYYGAYYANVLVGVMSFKEDSTNNWNLTRFTTDVNYSIPGLANKIFSQFTKEHPELVEVKSFLDRRWSHSDINVYDRLGFKLEKILKPDYRYVVGNKRKHKFGFRKQKLNKLYNLPLTMTETEMTQQLGFWKIWDCGLLKYVWKKNF